MSFKMEKKDSINWEENPLLKCPTEVSQSNHTLLILYEFGVLVIIIYGINISCCSSRSIRTFLQEKIHHPPPVSVL